MSRLNINTPNAAQQVVEGLYRDVERRIVASPPGLCPVDMSASFLKMCHAQTCGKCAPCRVGLGQLGQLLEDVLDGAATLDTIDLIERTARAIKNSADCAIGYEAADMVLRGVIGFRDDYVEHIVNRRCLLQLNQPVPCVALCPAGVDIPGYVALVGEGRYADAVRLIRKDNPFPIACAMVCEHPCEARCRRNMIDDSINIRALKLYAVEHCGHVPPPPCAPATGKKVAVVGGGPGGLSAAYFLSLMGHKVTVFEKRKRMGGMLAYGIPSYRLPAGRLEEDIQHILSTGVEVCHQEVGVDIPLKELRQQFDAMYIAIGAQSDKKMGIQGEDKRGVMSAVEMLRNIGDGLRPDFSGKRVVVIGGGNVAMDVTRSAIRLGADKVTCVYRRRQEDMTAQAEEVEGAIAEGAEVLTLQAPLRIEADEHGHVAALWTQPQIIGEMDKAGRPRPGTAAAEPLRIPADTIIVAIGQGIETRGLEQTGIRIQRGGALLADSSTQLPDMVGVFAGGDCVTGPATVIRAIAAGKAAAANIDEYLGFNHEIESEVKVPTPRCTDLRPRGRVNATERDACERKADFQCIECGMTDEEAGQESSRCLRCDHFGYGNFKGGRVEKW